MAKRKAKVVEQPVVATQQQTVELIHAGDFLEPEVVQGTTLRQLFEKVEWEIDDDAEVRVNMLPVTDLDTVVAPGDSVMVIGEINGG